MKFNYHQLPFLLLLVLLLLVALRPYFVPQLFQSHDAGTHTARLANYCMAINEGQLPPQLAPRLFSSIGYPIFIFIYPLPYFLGCLIHNLGLTYVGALKLIMGLGFFLSGAIFYFFAYGESKNKPISLLASLLFSYAPYRFSLLYVRGAFAESFSYVFVAISLFCFQRLLIQKKLNWFALSCLSLAGLLLSHQLSAIIFLPLILLYIINRSISVASLKRGIIWFLGAAVLALGVSAFIYLPTFFERAYLKFDQTLEYTNEHFVSLPQLLYSPWEFGFDYANSFADTMSFQIGPAHLFIIVLSMVTLLITRKKHLPQDSKKNLWLLTIAAYVVVFLMLENPLNHIIWSQTPIMKTIDFPWRLLGLVISIASLISLTLFKSKPFSYLVIPLIITVVIYSQHQIRIQGAVNFDDITAQVYTPSATSRNEFLTIWRKTDSWAGFYGDLTYDDPQITVNGIKTKTTLVEFLINSDHPTPIIINRLYFPGWQLYIDGIKQSLHTPAFFISSDQKPEIGLDYSGLIKTTIPSGTHTIKAVFTPTPIRIIGYLISILSLIITLLLIIINKLKLPIVRPYRHKPGSKPVLYDLISVL